jgi:polysaccharide deacetylase family protein (PEP-CTERM system associated)
MWWHCRWATGGVNSIWPDTQSLLSDYYGHEAPGNELVEYSENVLYLLDNYKVKATFFVLGEVATYFPALIKKIHDNGHEIACHGWNHIDATILGKEKFAEQVKRAKTLLEDLTGQPVLGYRAPNLVLAPWIFEEIDKAGFIYDSSICPSRKFFGKYADYEGFSNNPFLLPVSPQDTNSTKIAEIPIPVMPYFKLPACSGIITRILGAWWTNTALRLVLQKGDAMYYFHPYEIGARPILLQESLYLKIFLRNIGDSYTKMLHSILGRQDSSSFSLAKDIAMNLHNDSVSR